jgi:hypothetical protein
VFLLCYSAYMKNYWIFYRKTLSILTHTIKFLCILATDVQLIICNQWCLMLNCFFGLNTCLTQSTVCLSHKDNHGQRSYIQGGTKDPWYLVPCVHRYSKKRLLLFLSACNGIGMFCQISVKIANLGFAKNPSDGSCLFPCWLTDSQDATNLLLS